jgi:hypothetical protein
VTGGGPAHNDREGGVSARPVAECREARAVQGCGGGQDPAAWRAGPEGQRRSEEGEVESSRSGGGEQVWQR